MNKKAYYSKLVTLRNELDSESFSTLFNTVKIFNEVHDAVQNLSFETFNGPLNSTNVSSLRQSLVTNVQQAISKDKSSTRTRLLFKSLDSIDELIDGLYTEERPNLSRQLDNFVTCMNNFLDRHESYRVNFSLELAYQLSFASAAAIRSYNELKMTLDTILEGYLTVSTDENIVQLELYLAHVPSLRQFGIKLQTLDEIYGLVCNLCNLSITDNPIVIEHIEDGSLLLRFAGNPLVVGILTTVIGAGANYYIANYPMNKEITEMKETVETLDKMFELTEKLQDEGYPVEDMQENIAHTLKRLASASDILLGDQPRVEVNDKVYELDDILQAKLIEEKKRKLLENKIGTQEII